MTNILARRSTMLAFIASIAMLSARPASADDATSDVTASARYRQAIATMRALPEPPFMSFTTSLDGVGANVDLFREGSGRLSVTLSTGAAGTTKQFPTVFRSADRLAVVTLGDLSRGRSQSGLFDPIWPGVDLWIRYGIDGPGRDATSTSPPPTAAATPDGRLATIGGSSAFAVLSYRLIDVGPEACPSGAPGDHLHLIAYRDPDGHPLTDVVIDTTTGRICTMRFRLHQGGLVSLIGTADLTFRTVGTYDVVTSGTIVITAHLTFFTKRLGFTFERIGIAYPPTLADDEFDVRPAPSPSPG